MFRLLFLLSATMFLVLLIGGEDRGQTRHGLIAAAPQGAPAQMPQAQAEAPALPSQSDISLASFVPLSPPVPTPALAPAPDPAPVAQPAMQESLPAPEPVAAALMAEPAAAPAPLPLLFVNSNAINVRRGPSTDFAVVGRLTRNEAVLVVEPEQDGWVRIRIEGDGVEGFVASRLMTDRDPSGN